MKIISMQQNEVMHLNYHSRICINCKSELTYIDPKGFQRWYKTNMGYFCHKCRHKLIDGPKLNPALNRKWSCKRIIFKDRYVYFDYKLRTGFCSWCSNNIHDGSCMKTHIHHIQYHEDDPLKDTIELCVSCHMKETNRLWKIRKNK